MKRVSMRKAAAFAMTGFMAMSLAACGSSSDKTAAASSEEAAQSQEESAAGSAAGRTYKVAILKQLKHASLDQIQDSIVSELEAKGKELGVTFDISYEEGPDDLNQHVSNLMAEDPDIIIPIATTAAQVVQSQTEGEDIPILFSAIADPVGSGLVASMDAPGANITGTSDMLNTQSVMDMMFAVNPDIKKVGLLYSKSEDSSRQAIEDAKKYLDDKGIEYVEKTGTNTNELISAVDSLTEGSGKVDAVFTPLDNTVMSAELSIYEKLADAGVPHYGGADSFALNGAFCGYGVNYVGLGKATADMAVDILVNGADPATTPVQTFDNGIATINTETAEKLGLKLDDIKKAIQPYCTDIEETKTQDGFDK